MRTAAAVTALVMALAASAAGCSAGETEPSTLPPVESGSSVPSSTPSPSESDAPQSAPSLAPSGSVPADAVGTTPAAASAFARYFFEVINDAYAAREARTVQELSTQDCGSCAAVISDISRLADADHRVAGRRYVLSFAEAAPPLSDGRVLVDFRFTADPYIERDAQDQLVKEFPADPARDGQMPLAPAASSWRVTAIRLL